MKRAATWKPLGQTVRHLVAKLTVTDGKIAGADDAALGEESAPPCVGDGEASYPAVKETDRGEGVGATPDRGERRPALQERSTIASVGGRCSALEFEIAPLLARAGRVEGIPAPRGTARVPSCNV